jgi:hypothetical protein
MFSTVANKLAATFPPLYECKECGAAVKVTANEGADPTIVRSCGHTAAGIWANRKMTLVAKGGMELGVTRRTTLRIKLTARQFLSWLTGRSI